jgi:protein-arginine kinase
MDKIIEKYHGHGPKAKHLSSMDYKALNCPPFPADEDKMINSTRIRVARNLAAFPLGTAVTRAERIEIERLVTSALGEFTGDLAGKYYSLAKMSNTEKK